jgi:hypothetical protein
MPYPPGVSGSEDWLSCHDRHLDQVEAALCEGCMDGFEVGELAVIAEVDPDLKWCAACRARCLSCGHIRGVHATVLDHDRLRDGCDGDDSKCACLGFVAVLDSGPDVYGEEVRLP